MTGFTRGSKGSYEIQVLRGELQVGLGKIRQSLALRMKELVEIEETLSSVRGL